MINKGVSQTLDFILCLSSTISVTLYLAANNVIGVDQNGEIIFELNFFNCHIPILSLLFSLFFLILFNVVGGIFFKINGAEDVRT